MAEKKYTLNGVSIDDALNHGAVARLEFRGSKREMINWVSQASGKSGKFAKLSRFCEFNTGEQIVVDETAETLDALPAERCEKGSVYMFLVEKFEQKNGVLQARGRPLFAGETFGVEETEPPSEPPIVEKPKA